MTAGRMAQERSVLEEERDFFLRSLRDLEHELAVGDLDVTDYGELHADYTARAAGVLRRLEAMDAGGATAGRSTGADAPPGADGPVPAAAEASPGAAAAAADPSVPGGSAGGREPRRRHRRRRTVVVGAAVVALAGTGIAWAISSATASRAPGGVATGQVVGQEQVDGLLLSAEQATARGDGVTALKDLQSVLRTDPNQYVALTDEGWILAQTQQPQLLSQGIALLTHAATLQPGYAPARVYRGVAYLAESDYADAVTDLEWYLGHGPDPQLVPRVRTALTQALAGAARPVPTTAGGGQG